VVTKHAADGGAVTVDTVTAQLLYEIQGAVYLNSDVTLHLAGVELTRQAPDRVLVSGATGTPPPPTTKVAVFGQVGYQTVNTVYLTAPDVAAKEDLVRAQFHRDLPEGVELDITRIGTAAEDPETQLGRHRRPAGDGHRPPPATGWTPTTSPAGWAACTCRASRLLP